MIRKIGQRMSMTSIIGSMTIWTEFVKQMPHGRWRAEGDGSANETRDEDRGSGDEDLSEIRDEVVEIDEMGRELSESEEEEELGRGDTSERETDDHEERDRMTNDDRGRSQQEPFEASQEEEEEQFDNRMLETFILTQPATHSGRQRAMLKRREGNRWRSMFSGDVSSQSDTDEGNRPNNLVRNILLIPEEDSI
jgi:hypothetical protein